jgi:hypothetical protein
MIFLHVLAVALGLGSAQGQDYKVVFPNGHAVNVVAVSSGPTNKLIEWTPDGQPVTSKVAERIRQDLHPAEGWVPSRDYTEPGGLWVEDIEVHSGAFLDNVKVTIKGAKQDSGFDLPSDPYVGIGFCFLRFPDFKQLSSPAVVKVGFASGPFNSGFAVKRPIKLRRVRKGPPGTFYVVSIESSELTKWNGVVKFKIPSAFAQDDLRLVAYDKKGRLLKDKVAGYEIPLPPRDTGIQELPINSAVPLSRIGRMEIQVRPVQWKTIPGVCLKPAGPQVATKS